MPREHGLRRKRRHDDIINMYILIFMHKADQDRIIKKHIWNINLNCLFKVTLHGSVCYDINMWYKLYVVLSPDIILFQK